MRELLRTNDPTVIAFSTALLRGEDIDCFVLDVHMSVLEGSIGILPRRLMVADRDFFRARAVLRDNDVADLCRNELRARRISPATPSSTAGSASGSPARGYRAATDPVLLAAFVPARPGERVLDLGCGAGAAALCLAARVPGLDLHGLELQPAYAELARRNAAENGLALTVHEGDLRRPPAALRAPAPSTTCSPTRRSTAAAAPAAADPGRDRAHREAGAALADWIDAGLRRLVPGGRLVLIHRTARLGEILAALAGRAGVDRGPAARRRAPASRPARVLVRARKGRAGAADALASLNLPRRKFARRGDGESYTAEAQRLLRDMAELLPDARSGGMQLRDQLRVSTQRRRRTAGDRE